MKKRWIWAASTVAVVLAGGAAAMMLIARREAEYQRSATGKRINDVHKIADLLEAYSNRTGHLPLDRDIPSGEALTVIVGAPEVERTLQPNGNPLGAEPPSLASAELLAELQAKLGPTVSLPVDPQKVSNGPPNAYYVRFRANGQYLVAGFLRQPHAATVEVWPGVFGYGLRSRDGDWGPIWNRARQLDQVPESEREAIRVVGNAEDRRFGLWVANAQN